MSVRLTSVVQVKHDRYLNSLNLSRNEARAVVLVFASGAFEDRHLRHRWTPSRGGAWLC